MHISGERAYVVPFARILLIPKVAALSALSARKFFQKDTGFRDFLGKKVVKEAPWR